MEFMEEIKVFGGNAQVAPSAAMQQQNIFGNDAIGKLLNRPQHPITVAVTGAGVDATMGIPTSAGLIPRIAEYLDTDEGKAVDDALRKAIGRVTFHFDKFVEKAIDSLAKSLDREIRTICSSVRAELDDNVALTDDQRRLGILIVRLFHKIIDVRDHAGIDADTAALISEVMGMDVHDDTIIDFNRLSYTDTFKTVITLILKKSMHESDNPILRHVYRNILDIEQLLTKYFYGFYDGRDGYIRDYMYIAWTLWAFLVREQQRIAAGNGIDGATRMPAVYSSLQGEGLQWVTFNYTTFARQADSTALYFRGSLMEYVDVENKNDITLDNILDIDLVDFFQSRLSQEICFDSDSRSLPIPSFLPPLKIQPVISKRYINVWYQTGEMIRHAGKVILLGISLAGIDSFFADMLRESQAAEIIVIDKDLDTACCNLCRIFQQSPASYSRLQIAGHEARKYNNRLTVIQADLTNVEGVLE